jgi:hypothetical protein
MLINLRLALTPGKVISPDFQRYRASVWRVNLYSGAIRGCRAGDKTSPNESRELRVVLPLLSSLCFPEKLIVPKKIFVSPTKQTIHSSNFHPRHTTLASWRTTRKLLTCVRSEAPKISAPKNKSEPVRSSSKIRDTRKKLREKQ